jgi:signal recognition particle subunit SRP54
MFDTLSQRFDGILGRLRSRGRLGDEEVDEVLREIRVALLEADVALPVVRALVERIRARCVGAELSKSLSPAQQVIKIVSEELTATMGGEGIRIRYASPPPTVVLLAGLQGAGKTTTAAKLARWFRTQGRNPLLVGADLQRPAAVEQLRILGEQAGVRVFSEWSDPVSVSAAGVAEAKRTGRDVVIVDTAGRLAVDDELMAEMAAIAARIQPHYTFLVVDAMTGQDAVRSAERFHATLDLDGVILTKLDGDARGGAALSVKEVVGRPVAFASTGERLGDFELFHPDRMASRILGMGDVLTLIEQAEQHFDRDSTERAAERLATGSFGLDDFLDQLNQLKRLGPLKGVLGMLPGLPRQIKDAEIDDRELARIEAIIRSMTPEERRNPAILNGSRRLRVARGSGTSTTEVNSLLGRFREMQQMMRQLGVQRPPAAGGRRAGGSRRAGKAKRGKSVGGQKRQGLLGAGGAGGPGTLPSLADLEAIAKLRAPGPPEAR